MNKFFLAKLGEFFRNNKAAIEASELTEEEVAEAFRTSRAHAGGKQRSENRMSMSEQFDGKNGDCRMFFDHQFAEPPMTIQVLPKPGTYSHPKWGKFSLTTKDLQEFVDNHNNHVYQEQIPIDAEHQTKLSGAVGYYREMRLVDGGKGGAEADVEWTERGQELIRTDAFKYFSPEYFDQWPDPATGKKHNHVIAGGAITTRPFFKDKVLRPLVASESSYAAGEWEGEDDEPKTLIMSAMQFTEEGIEEEEPKKASLDPGDVHVDVPKEEEEPKKAKGGNKKMAEEPQTGVDDVTKAFVESQTKQLTEELAEQKGLRKAAEERLAKLEGDAQARRFTDIVRGRDAEGDGSPPFQGKTEGHHRTMVLLAREFGEDSDEFKEYVATQREISKQMREAGLYKEAGINSGGTQAGGKGSAKKRFNEAVGAWLTANPGKAKDEAIKAVSTEDAKLYVEYITEGNKTAKTASTNYGYDDNDDEEGD